jgi:hypothetical protein
LLIFETWGTDIRNALSSSASSIQGGFGFDCLETANFTGRVNIEVRTANFQDGQIVINPSPFFETTLLNQSFSNNTGFNYGSLFDISVPETGGYLLIFEVELTNCSICCHGLLDRQCGDDIREGKCSAGLPRVIYERVFTVDTRPAPNFNYKIEPPEYIVRQCVCGCDVDC